LDDNLVDYFDDLLKKEIKRDDESERYHKMFKLPTENPLFAQPQNYMMMRSSCVELSQITGCVIAILIV